jgi:HPt (histidine-containing phosphotransfer) domain-containing protein
MDIDPQGESQAAQQEDAQEERFRKRVADLVPRYLAGVRKDVSQLSSLLEAGSLERIRVIAHDLKGTGSSFGFPELTYWGAAMEESVLRADVPKLAEQIASVVALLARIS